MKGIYNLTLIWVYISINTKALQSNVIRFEDLRLQMFIQLLEVRNGNYLLEHGNMNEIVWLLLTSHICSPIRK